MQIPYTLNMRSHISICTFLKLKVIYFLYLYNDLSCAYVNINVLNVSENRMF